MFTYTHFKIANIVYDYFLHNYNIRLNRKAFVWGNIKPDLSSAYIPERHYEIHSKGHVIDRIIELYNTNKDCLLKNNVTKEIILANNLNNISLHMGMVCHFLSDFFCVPHQQYWTGSLENLKEHFKYEIKLDKFVSNKNLYSKIMLPSTNGDFSDKSYLNKFLTESINEYETKSSYSRDYYFAMNVCIDVLKKVLDNMSPTLSPLTNV